MKLTIFAATGGIGQQLLTQAAAAGHDVTAVVRDPRKLAQTAWDAVRVVEADLGVAESAQIESAVRGADAVLSGLGARSFADADAGITWRGTRAMLDAMTASDVRRIVAVSAAPIGTVPSPGRPNPPKHDPGDGFFMRHMFAGVARTAFRRQYADVARMEDVLRDSGLDWTAVRPPKLTDKALTGEYRTAIGRNIVGGWSISRADVAHCMLRVLEQPETIRQTVGLAN
jgi:putative NADH-flavin reductase